MFGPDFFEYVAQRESQYFKKYLELIETRSADDDARLKSIEEDIKKEGKENDENAIEYFQDLAYENWEFEQMMYKSFVISVFIFMEDLANQLCRNLQRETGQSFSYRDLSGTGVGRSINYLKKLLGEHPIANTEIRDEFSIAQRVRNALVHADGALKKEDMQSIESFIKKHPGILKVNEQTRHVELTNQYAKSLLELLTNFTKELRERWK